MEQAIWAQFTIPNWWQVILSYLVMYAYYMRLSKRIVQLSDAYRRALRQPPDVKLAGADAELCTGRELYELQMTWLRSTLSLVTINLVLFVARSFDEPCIGLSNALLGITGFFGWAGYNALMILVRLRREYLTSRTISDRVRPAQGQWPLD